MITTLIFHRVHADNLPDLSLFDHFLQQIRAWGTPCLPGEPIPSHAHGICLTFDDAYFDFYHYVFPLLKRYQLPAVLAIPTALIADQITMDAETRLQLQYQAPLDNQILDNPSLCSWRELKEMVDSGWVIPASHGASHVALNDQSNWTYEIVQSQKQLQDQLGKPVSTFVYPYGRFDKATHHFVCQYYQYAMRIGGAANFSWHHRKKFIYRINADNYWPNKTNPFSPLQRVQLGLKAMSNTIRGR